MAAEDDRKLFVAGLPEGMTEEVLRTLFEATGGGVLQVSLPRDRETGRPRGFGFVTMASPEDAARARQELDGSFQAGQSISVRPFQAEPPRRGEGAAGGAPRGPRRDADRGQDRTLYVGNLPYDVAQADLEALFEERGVGPIARIHLPVGPDGRLRGFGFVTLATADAANAAILALREAELRGRRLLVNIAHPRERSGPPGGAGAPGHGGGGGSPRGWDAGPPPPLEEPVDEDGRRKDGKKRRGGGGRGGAGAGARGGGRGGGGERWDRRRDWDDD